MFKSIIQSEILFSLYSRLSLRTRTAINKKSYNGEHKKILYISIGITLFSLIAVRAESITEAVTLTNSLQSTKKTDQKITRYLHHDDLWLSQKEIAASFPHYNNFSFPVEKNSHHNTLSTVKNQTHNNTIVPTQATTKAPTNSVTKLSPTASDSKDSSSYFAVYRTVTFLILAYFAGEVSVLVGVPHYVGAIIIGALCGSHICNLFDEAGGGIMITSGWIGVSLLFFLVGLEFEHSKVRMGGLISVSMSLVGIAAAFGTFFGIGKAYGLSHSHCIVLASIFVPTSIGCFLRDLHLRRILNTPLHHFVMSAVLYDDIAGIFIIPLLGVMSKSHDQPVKEYIFAILSFLSFFTLTYVAMLYNLPNIIIDKGLMKVFPKSYNGTVTFSFVSLIFLLFMPLMRETKSSFLVGAFLAGLLFSNTPLTTYHYVTVGKYFVQFFVRLFFAATVGLMLPLQEVNSNPSLFGWGVFLFVGTFTKAIAGAFAPIIVGYKNVPESYPYNPLLLTSAFIASMMCCRGELAIIIATFAYNRNLLGPELYCSVILAILIWVIPMSFAFKYAARNVLRERKNNLTNISPDNIEETGGTMPLYIVIQIRSRAQNSYHYKLKQALSRFELFEYDHRIWYPKRLKPIVVTEIYAADINTKLEIPRSFGQPTVRGILDVETAIEKCKTIHTELKEQLTLEDMKIKVMQWTPGKYEEIDLDDELTNQDEYRLTMDARRADIMTDFMKVQADSTRETGDRDLPTLFEGNEEIVDKGNLQLNMGNDKYETENEVQLSREFPDMDKSLSSSSSEEGFTYESFKKIHRHDSNGSSTSGQIINHASIGHNITLLKPKILGQSLWFYDHASQEAAMSSNEKLSTYYEQTFGRGFGMNSNSLPYLRLEVELKVSVEERLVGIVREVRSSTM